eukprot:9872390-Heterocapsa_arctica.AAC.1
MGKVYDWFEERLEIQAIADDITSKYVPPHPRELTWVTGVTLAVVTVSFGVTGYSLPWDQVGYWACKIVTGVPEAIPVVGTLACVIGLSVLAPSPIGEKADPFATPLEILPEWYFFPTFNLLRVIPNKLLGVLSMAAVPVGLITVPFIESVNKFQNPFRRPVAMT